MSFLNILKSARESPASVYIQFLQQYKFNGSTLHLFLESRVDQSFYVNFVELYKANEIKLHVYNCRNKNGVYKNYQLINWQKYDKRKTLFFVDKDYSDILNISYPVDQNIFVTRYYSIENYIVTKYMLERVLRELMHVDDDGIVEVLKSQFEEQHQNFSNLFIIISVWIIHQKRDGKKVSLNNLNLGDIFKVRDDLSVQRKLKPKNQKLLSYLESRTSTETREDSWKDLMSEYRKIINLNHKYHLRGKFELWFFITFISKIPKLLNNQLNSRNYKIRPQISASIAIEILGPRMQIPEDLKIFLESNLTS